MCTILCQQCKLLLTKKRSFIIYQLSNLCPFYKEIEKGVEECVHVFMCVSNIAKITTTAKQTSNICYVFMERTRRADDGLDRGHRDSRWWDGCKSIGMPTSVALLGRPIAGHRRGHYNQKKRQRSISTAKTRKKVRTFRTCGLDVDVKKLPGLTARLLERYP